VEVFWKIVASFLLPVYGHGAERQSLAAVASGFRRVHALGGVSGTPPVMTRTMTLHGRLTGRAQDAIRQGADEKPST
jgi:hypothetical protein